MSPVLTHTLRLKDRGVVAGLSFIGQYSTRWVNKLTFPPISIIEKTDNKMKVLLLSPN